MDYLLNGEISCYNTKDYNEKSPFVYFAELELNNFKSVDTPQSKIYKDFIDKNLVVFETIDFLANNKLRNKYTVSLKTFLSHKINPDILHIGKLESVFNIFYKDLFTDNIHDLILYNEFQQTDKEQYLNTILDFKLIVEPSSLLTEQEHHKYLEALYNWNKYAINEIAKKTSISYNPPIVQLFLQKLQSFIPQKEEPKPVLLEKSLLPENPNVDYPRFVFANYKSYVLFHTIAQKMDSHSQISFLFRHMSEKENPPLIVVPNNQFVKWFNEEQYPVDLDYTTKTYSQSANSERLGYYSIIKSFIFND